MEVLGLDPMDAVHGNQNSSEETKDILYDVYENATMDGCFLSFDVDKNDSLSIDEFDRLLKRLFKDKEGHAHYMDENKRKSIFDIFDKSGDELINKNEFLYCWESWIRKVYTHLQSHIHTYSQKVIISNNKTNVREFDGTYFDFRSFAQSLPWW